MINTTHTVDPEWQNENELRAFPLEDDAPAASVLPSWLISDLHITADPMYRRLYVSSAYVSDTLVSVGISGVAADGSVVGLLTRSVTRDELTPFKSYSLDRLTDTAAGVIAFGDPADSVPFRMTFSQDEAPILLSALTRIKTPGVSRIVDGMHGVSISGIVDLSGNNEFRTYVDPEDATGKTVVIALDDTYRDVATSVCSTEPSFSSCGETPVQTINGVSPTRDGTITLRFR